MGRTCPKYHKGLRPAAILVIFTLTASYSFMASARELVDRVVAVVGGEPILHSEVKQKVERGPLVMVSEYPLTESASPYERALQDAINFELILLEAEELGLDITDEELNAEINRFLEARDLNKTQLDQLLRREGMTFETYRADFKEQLLLRRFQQRVILPRVKVTDKDVQTYYLKTAGSAGETVVVDVRQIMIRMPENAPESVRQAKKDLVQDVYQKLEGGMAFAEAAKLYSDAPGVRETGGLLQGLKLKDLAANLREPLDGLSEGQYSEPIATATGFFILQLVKKKFSGGSEFEQKKQRVEAELRNKELLNQMQNWLTEQRQRIRVSVLDK